MYPEPNQKLTYETDDTVYFFSGPFDPLNNFSAHTVNIWGKTFQTVEHAFQWKKFELTEPELANKIEKAGSPWLAKIYSKESKNYLARWHDIKVEIMFDIVSAKVAQHQDVRKILMATGDKKIVENSPVDDFWGCGSDGKGQNQSGKILMRIRKESK
jgi:N-glycosidase YbiA